MTVLYSKRKSMMNTKKILAILVMSSMILGSIPAIHASTFISIIQVNPPHGTVDTQVTVTISTGDPLTAFSLCYVADNLHTPTTPCTNILPSGSTTDAAGHFTGTFNVPASVQGKHPLLAVETSDTTIRDSGVGFTVDSHISLVQRLGLFTLPFTSGAVDDAFQVVGTGFAGSSNVAVNHNLQANPTCVSATTGLPQVVTDQFGSFRANCKVPETPFVTGLAVPSGTVEVEAVDQSNNMDAQTFTLVPSVTINPKSGTVGVGVDTDSATTLNQQNAAKVITVQARGFIAQSDVIVCFNRSLLNGVAKQCTTGKTSALGSFSYQYNNPEIPAGQYVFDADQTVNTVNIIPVSAVRSDTFRVVSDLDLTPDHGRFNPGPSQVTASGTGFAAKSQVTVTVRKLTAAADCSGAVVATLTTTLSPTQPTGSFILGFSTPNVPPGLYQVYAIDAQGNNACSDFALGLFLRIKPGTPSEGKVGDTVTVQGYSFAQSSPITISMTSTGAAGGSCDSIATTFKTDSNGDFGTNANNGNPATLTIPNCNHGDYNIVATDSDNAHSSASYRVFSWIEITPTSGAVGTKVTVTGTGFASKTSVDVIYFGGANSAMDQLAPRAPLGFNSGNSRLIWSGTIPQDVSAFSNGMLLTDLTGVWQIETVGGEYTTTITSGSLGNFVTTFNVPESWGGYHPVYALETLMLGPIALKLGCGPDGTGPVVHARVLCGQAFRTQPTVTATPTDPKAGETMLLTGTGFTWWDHYSTQTVSGQTPNVVSKVYRLAFDIGRSVGYIDEARHILNGQRDPSWNSGDYLPVALNQKGTIVYWDYRLEDHTGTVTTGTTGSLGQIGSPFLKAPNLQPGDNMLVAYRLTLGSLPTRDDSESTTATLKIKSAELDATGGIKADVINKVTDAQNAIMGSISTATTTISSGVSAAISPLMTVANNIKTSTDQISAIKDTVNTVKTTSDSLAASAASLKSTTDSIKASADQFATIRDTANSIKTDTSNIKADTSNLTTNTVPLVLQSPMGYLIVVLAAIAALGAVASALLISRRLKVVK